MAYGRIGAGPVLPATRHGFDRIERRTPVTAPPRELLRELGIASPRLCAELDDAIVNLAMAYRRRAAIDARWHSPDGDLDDQAIAYERLATDGHNLHPCGRTRIGWAPADVLAYDQEAEPFEIEFVAIRKDLHVGDDVGALLAEAYPGVPEAPAGYVVQPVHPWQRSAVLRHRGDELIRLPGGIEALPTVALRTLLLPPDRTGTRRYLKVSLDIQVTSTRRSISVASTQNGPHISALLYRLIGDDDRVVLMPETAGAALRAGRDASAILRGGLGRRAAHGEVAMTAAALPAISPTSGRTLLSELVTRSGLTAATFLQSYARLLLTPLLRLLDAGIGLEAHLQNCVPIFRDGLPVRIALPRLCRAAPAHATPGRPVGAAAAVARLGDRRGGHRGGTGEDRLHRAAGTPRRADRPAGRRRRPGRGAGLAERGRDHRRDLRRRPSGRR